MGHYRISVFHGRRYLSVVDLVTISGQNGAMIILDEAHATRGDRKERRKADLPNHVRFRTRYSPGYITSEKQLSAGAVVMGSRN